MVHSFFYLNFNINLYVIEYLNCQQSLNQKAPILLLIINPSSFLVALNEILRDTFSTWPALQWAVDVLWRSFPIVEISP